MPLLEVRDIKKSFHGTVILDHCDFSLEKEKIVAISGPSGSGKTTLLHMISGMIPPDNGTIIFDGVDYASMNEHDAHQFVSKNIGVVFQAFYLLPFLTVAENVSVPGLFHKNLSQEFLKKRISYLLERVGLAGFADKKVSELSGGQRQRVAVARALVHSPRLILADEPTGNLDEATASQVTHLLEDIAREEGASVLLVTHEQAYLERVDDVWDLKDKKLTLRNGK